MNFVATKSPIGHGHTVPPDSFIRDIVCWGRAEVEAVFAPNDALGDHDIYNILNPVLGPWQSPLHRRAVMCEVLRVLAGDESDWDWSEGRDTTAGPETPEQEETGAFQVSYDSIHLGEDLQEYLEMRGIASAAAFIGSIKANPILDLGYTARLLRDATRWDGPINRGWVTSQVNRDAVTEFMSLLSLAAP